MGRNTARQLDTTESGERHSGAISKERDALCAARADTQMAGFGDTEREIRCHALESGNGNVAIRCLAGDI